MQTKDHAFQSKACAEFAKLRTVQAELEQEAGQPCFLGCSVTQTGLTTARHGTFWFDVWITVALSWNPVGKVGVGPVFKLIHWTF